MYKGNHRKRYVSFFCKELEDMGYKVVIETLDTRNITGFPVKENRSFILGASNYSDINLEFLNNIDSRDYLIDEFVESKENDEWYYKIKEDLLYKSEIVNRDVQCQKEG